MSTPAFASGTPIDPTSLHTALQPLVARSAEQARRLRVAQGMLPVPPDALVPAQLYLTADPELPVRQAAKEALLAMPSDMLGPVLQAMQDITHLDTAARALYKSEMAAQATMLNSHTADDTVRWLAGVASKAVCDTIGRNQVRALRYPAIIEALYLNPAAAQGVIQGLLELAVHENLALDHMPGFREAKALVLGEEKEDEKGLDDAEFASAMLMATRQGEQNLDPNAPVDEKRTSSLQALILKMSVSQKVRLAMVGDSSVRKLLVRDPKKLVSMAVLKSPRLTDGEVTSFAANKALPDDLLAQICRNRQWTKDYSTRKALVFNPKTPITFSMTFLRTLTAKDLKDCSTSREVNQTIARTAKRMVMGDKKG